MAEFQGIFCHPYLPSVLIIEGVGGMRGGERWDGVGWGGTGWGGVGWGGTGWGRVMWGGVGWEVAKTTVWDTP